MTTDLSVRQLPTLMQFAEVAVEARGLLPAHITTSAHAAVIIQAGAELGLAPMAALRGIILIKGNVTLKADAMLAILLSRGCKISYPVHNDKEVTVRLTRPDNPEPFEVTWTMEMAKKAGLSSTGSWQKYGRAMLRARAVSEMARAACPDLLHGVYVEGELGEAEEVPMSDPVAPSTESPAPDGWARAGDVLEALPSVEPLTVPRPNHGNKAMMVALISRVFEPHDIQVPNRDEIGAAFIGVDDLEKVTSKRGFMLAGEIRARSADEIAARLEQIAHV